VDREQRRHALADLIASGAWEDVPALVDAWPDDADLLPSIEAALAQRAGEPWMLELPLSWEERLHRGEHDPRLLLCTDFAPEALTETLCRAIGETPHNRNIRAISFNEGVERDREKLRWSADIEDVFPLAETHRVLFRALSAARLPALRSLCVLNIRASVDCVPILSAPWVPQLSWLDLNTNGDSGPLLAALDAHGDALSLTELYLGSVHDLSLAQLAHLAARPWVPARFREKLVERLRDLRASPLAGLGIGASLLVPAAPPPDVAAGRYTLTGYVYERRGALSDVQPGCAPGTTEGPALIAGLAEGLEDSVGLPHQHRCPAPAGVLVLESGGRYESRDRAAEGCGVSWFDRDGCEVTLGGGAGDLDGVWAAGDPGRARLLPDASAVARHRDGDTIVHDVLSASAGAPGTLRRRIAVLTDGWHVTVLDFAYAPEPSGT